MTEQDITSLQEEAEHFHGEREKIRQLIGKIGGKKPATRDRIINVLFVITIVAVFSLDILRYAFGIPIPLPSQFLIELGILLVSIKIIWMIHKQSKIEHFQFWILNSIEFRLNDISKRIKKIEKQGNKP